MVREFPWQDWSCNPPNSEFCNNSQRRQKLFEAHEGAKNALRETKRGLSAVSNSANRHLRSQVMARFRRNYGTSAPESIRRAEEIVGEALSRLSAPGFIYEVSDQYDVEDSSVYARAGKGENRISICPLFFFNVLSAQYSTHCPRNASHCDRKLASQL